MCGIAGFYNAEINLRQCEALVQNLKHRGPDAQDFYVSKDVGLIHTRLSVLELSDLGAQPYFFESLVLTFNGEIYNFKDIREDLRKLGYSFISNSDTEVLVKSFHCWREKCVDRFIGMFAFAIYDTQVDELFLFRDRLGVKPVYYSCYQGSFFFASELKAFPIFEIPKTVNIAAVYSYFRFGFVPASQSIYQDVLKLEAGHYLHVTRKGKNKKKFWDPGTEIIEGKTEGWWIDHLEEILVSSFKYRMVSDVPVGVFLSGGIDSALLAAILQRHCGGIHSFTIGFEEKKFDESFNARRVANHLNIQHTEEILTLEKAKSLFDSFYDIYDEPFADTSGIPIAFVTQLAKRQGMKVVLSADGGDELFGGYSHYKKAYKLYRYIFGISNGIRRGLNRTTQALIPPVFRKEIMAYNFEHKAYALEELLGAGSSFDFYESFLANQSNAEIANMIPGIVPKQLADFGHLSNPVLDMMNWDTRYYLPDDLLVKVDRATMYYGIESREPFLDHRLAEFAMRMPLDLKIKNGEQKYLLKKVLQRYVPASFFDGRKRGFSIPIFAWFSQALDQLFTRLLTSDNIAEIGFLNQSEINAELKKYHFYKSKGRQYNMEKMWRILSFVMWWDKYGEKRS